MGTTYGGVPVYLTGDVSASPFLLFYVIVAGLSKKKFLKLIKTLIVYLQLPSPYLLLPMVTVLLWIIY